ncbi:MAG: PLD nuclease N-terminal domain-containing protein [Woeseiaceae bacterium]
MEVKGILGVLVLLADVYAILQIAQSSATNGKKALWIVLVLLLPVIGVIIWYLAGPGRPS